VLTENQVGWLESFFEEVERCQSLSSFEQFFVESTRKWFSSYGRKWKITVRQWEVLRRIGRELGMEEIE
jgi:hypothetical protein